MVMQALPEIAKYVAEPLSKVDKITMYGAGNSAKLLEDMDKAIDALAGKTGTVVTFA